MARAEIGLLFLAPRDRAAEVRAEERARDDALLGALELDGSTRDEDLAAAGLRDLRQRDEHLRRLERRVLRAAGEHRCGRERPAAGEGPEEGPAVESAAHETPSAAQTAVAVVPNNSVAPKISAALISRSMRR